MKLKNIICIALVATLTACVSRSDVSHLYRAVGTGTKLGVTQNPETQMYELGLERVQSEFTQVPVIYTNGVFVIPDAVLRYEMNTHSAIFGNVAITSTMATGTNAVASQVGGASPPINSGTGTSNNLSYQGGATASTATNK